MGAAEIVSVISDITLAVAAGVTAYAAVTGLRSWERELKGRAGFELARSFARATYKLRDEVRMCRTPLLRLSEWPEGYDHQKQDKDHDYVADGYAHVYTKRWGAVIGAMQAFDAQALEAEALWGEDIRAKATALRSCVVRLHSAIDAYIDNVRSGGENFRVDREFGREIRSEVSALSVNATDSLSQAIDAAVLAIEDEIRPHLDRIK